MLKAFKWCQVVSISEWNWKDKFPADLLCCYSLTSSQASKKSILLGTARLPLPLVHQAIAICSFHKPGLFIIFIIRRSSRKGRKYSAKERFSMILMCRWSKIPYLGDRVWRLQPCPRPSPLNTSGTSRGAHIVCFKYHKCGKEQCSHVFSMVRYSSGYAKNIKEHSQHF